MFGGWIQLSTDALLMDEGDESGPTICDALFTIDPFIRSFIHSAERNPNSQQDPKRMNEHESSSES
jgi:hypothetical protein